MQSFFKVTSCNIKYTFKAIVLDYNVLITSGLCPLFYYALKDDQPAQTDCVRFSERERRINMAPVKHRLPDEFSLEPKMMKQARVSSPKPILKRHMSPEGGGSGHRRERKGDPSAVSKSCDVQVAPLPPHESKRGQKRSPSGSSVSDDSLSPPPVKVNYRCTLASKLMHKGCVCVCMCVYMCLCVCVCACVCVSVCASY